MGRSDPIRHLQKFSGTGNTGKNRVLLLSPESKVTVAPNPGKSWEVLLVEDNPADVTLFEMAIPKDKRVHVSSLADGRQALDFLYKRAKHSDAPRPDLIFLNLNLPIIDGREVLDAIKADADLRGIPIVVLSTSGIKSDIADSYKRGANSYIVKPADVNALFRMMNSCCEYWFQTVALDS